MAHRGDVAIVVAGRSYTLRLTNNAVCDAEEAGGKPFAELVRLMSDGMVSAVRLVLWAALRQHHADMTIKDAGNLIDAGRADIGTALGKALTAAFGDGSDHAGDAAGAAGNGAGSTGSPIGAKPGSTRARGSTKRR